MTPEKIALKRATAEMIKGVGGVEAAAGYCRVGKSVLSDNGSANRPDSFVAIDVVADLQPLAAGREGWPQITRALAAADGFALVKLPEAMPDGSALLHLLARLARENGEIARAVCEALADGKVCAGEAKRIRGEVRDLIEGAVAMDAALAKIEGGE